MSNKRNQRRWSVVPLETDYWSALETRKFEFAFGSSYEEVDIGFQMIVLVLIITVESDDANWIGFTLV